jgi:hypothetical protein
VANAAKCNISYVTPWLWLGGGLRRTISTSGTTGMREDFRWDYDIAYSWILGRELADPFYGQHAQRFAPWGAARAVALFPNTFSSDSWTVPALYNKTCPHCTLSGAEVAANRRAMLESVTFRHFVAYALGAAGVGRTNATD